MENYGDSDVHFKGIYMHICLSDYLSFEIRAFEWASIAFALCHTQTYHVSIIYIHIHIERPDLYYMHTCACALCVVCLQSQYGDFVFD